jgi:capsular polysaccharide biosynthesis protein
MTSEEFKDPLDFRTLLRYKLLILSVATVIVLGGYLKIVTQRPQYTAVARMRVRFSQELLNAPDLGSGSVRTPVLEEEVKSYLVLLRDPNFIDQVIAELPPKPEAPVDKAEEEVDAPSVYDVLLNEALGLVGEVKNGVVSFLDTILFIKDTIVSTRERRVLSTLSKLSVEQGTDASHVITVSYTGLTAAGATTMANAVTFTFIQQQKSKTRPRDIEKLQREVDDAKKYLENVNHRRYELVRILGYPSIETAITRQNDTLEALRLEEDDIRRGLALLAKDIIPTHKKLPINTAGLEREAERAIMERLMTVLIDQSGQPENFQIFAGLEEKLLASRKMMKADRVREMRVELEALLERAQTERELIVSDDRVVKNSPEYSAIIVDEKVAQTRLLQAEAKLLLGDQFNQQLEREFVAENVALLAAAQPPPFPDQEQRLLKLIVIIVLGIAAGFGAATLRHLVWPKVLPNQQSTFSPGSLADLDVPIIVLPDESEDNLESDLEFDMTFPEEDESRSSRT